MAIDPKTGKLLPFQILSTRKRKAESEADIKVGRYAVGVLNVVLVGFWRRVGVAHVRLVLVTDWSTNVTPIHPLTHAYIYIHIQVQVVLYAFDILYLNDRPVLQEPLIQRRYARLCF